MNQSLTVEQKYCFSPDANRYTLYSQVSPLTSFEVNFCEYSVYLFTDYTPLSLCFLKYPW